MFNYIKATPFKITPYAIKSDVKRYFKGHPLLKSVDSSFVEDADGEGVWIDIVFNTKGLYTGTDDETFTEFANEHMLTWRDVNEFVRTFVYRGVRQFYQSRDDINKTRYSINASGNFVLSLVVHYTSEALLDTN